MRFRCVQRTGTYFTQADDLDVHTATGGWGNKNWPLVPGHGKLDRYSVCMRTDF